MHGRRQVPGQQPCRVSPTTPSQIESGPTSVMPQELHEGVIMGKRGLNIRSRGIRVRLGVVKSPWASTVCTASHRSLFRLCMVFLALAEGHAGMRKKSLGA
jgi:hypothetical protein